MNTYEITPEAASRISEWIATRGGVAVWRNCNMSSHSIGSEAFTQATKEDGSPATSQGWQYGQSVESIETDIAAFTVKTYRETTRVKAVPSKYGPPCDPVARGRKALDKALEQAGEGAVWRWNYDSGGYGSAWREIIVEAPDKTVPLSDWTE